MSKGAINSITLDKTVILGSGSAEVTVDYTASGSDVFTLDDFVDRPEHSFNYKDFFEEWNETGGSIEEKKLTEESDADKNNYFGRSVAIDGDYAIVGAYGYELEVYPHAYKNAGAVYIFKRDGSNWARQAKLTADDGYYIDNFGWSVAISGDYAIVGAE